MIAITSEPARGLLPADALYVAPDAEAAMAVNEADLIEEGLLGGYRKALGWSAGARAVRSMDQSFRLKSGA
jgi:hypothetical protein